MFYANNWHYREMADFYPQGWLDDCIEKRDIPKVIYPESTETVSDFIEQCLDTPPDIKVNDLSGWSEDMIKFALCARRMFRKKKIW